MAAGVKWRWGSEGLLSSRPGAVGRVRQCEPTQQALPGARVVGGQRGPLPGPSGSFRVRGYSGGAVRGVGQTDVILDEPTARTALPPAVFWSTAPPACSSFCPAAPLHTRGPPTCLLRGPPACSGLEAGLGDTQILNHLPLAGPACVHTAPRARKTGLKEGRVTKTHLSPAPQDRLPCARPLHTPFLVRLGEALFFGLVVSSVSPPQHRDSAVETSQASLSKTNSKCLWRRAWEYRGAPGSLQREAAKPREKL